MPVSTEQQRSHRRADGPHPLGVGDDRIYMDPGRTGSNRDRPGLRLVWPLAGQGNVTKRTTIAVPVQPTIQPHLAFSDLRGLVRAGSSVAAVGI